MNSTAANCVLSLDEAATYRPQQIVDLSRDLANAKHQIDWFKRQIFGQKSERRLLTGSDGQMSLGETLDAAQTTPPPVPAERHIAAHTRTKSLKKPDTGDDSLPFFDETRVPIEVIELAAPETAGLAPEDFEVIGHKDSFRLAQRPGSYVVLKYQRPVIKLKATQAIVCAAAPIGVIEGSRADVSFIAGLLIDKFAYHLPFYRQHQRLTDAGITVSRPWLTQIGQQGIALLEPIYEAQLASIRTSRVKAMDETPIKAGRAGPGKLKAAYFWPVYGYVNKTGITHAQCWAHTRRHLFEAKDVEPAVAARGLDFIGGLYAVEERIREQKLSTAKKLDYRLTYAKPIVEQFFAWVNEQFEAQGLLPSNPMTKALAYARERRFGLEVYLTDPDVPIDTNHLERALRVIPMGRRNWLFCWTELGARHVGIMQSLIVTCRLHEIDPYDYLVDVLQRVGQHPASRVEELTPRLWKQHFAANPLRSTLQRRQAETRTPGS